MSEATLVYPNTPARPVELRVGPVAYTDAYLWLEEDGAETLAWQARQQALTDRYFSEWPYLDTLAALLARLGEGAPPGRWDVHLEMPVVRGSRWFRAVAEEGRDQKVLKVFDAA